MFGAWPTAQADSDAMVRTLQSLPRLHTLSVASLSASVLARLLLGCSSLTLVSVWGNTGGVPLLDSPASAAVLCDTLRANTRLQTLMLHDVDVWRNVDAATALLAALHGHPTLQIVHLFRNAVPVEHTVTAGAALGALIAHLPTLRRFSISHCALGDAGLGPIMDALPLLSRLRLLDIEDNGMSEAFARERLLPAVRACASLRELKFNHDGAEYGVVEEIQLLLQQRS